MGQSRPFKRTARPFLDGDYMKGGRWRYILHEKYAEEPEHYIRAFQILQKDFLSLFEYIEPADKNLPTYSFRIHELLLRVCIEIEANCVAILSENGYKKRGNWYMEDYKKIEKTHRLSSYEVKLPVWKGSQSIRQPYKKWETGGSLPWYKAYNTTKHNRHSEFENATFEHLVDAMCGLVVILSAQFLMEDFSPSDGAILAEGRHNDGMESAIGDYFRVKFPDDWPEEDRYDFSWEAIEKDEEPFLELDFT